MIRSGTYESCTIILIDSPIRHERHFDFHVPSPRSSTKPVALVLFLYLGRQALTADSSTVLKLHAMRNLSTVVVLNSP